MRKAAAVLALVSLALFDCATLDPLGDGACGNGVIDANEDCDGFAPAGIATGKCGAPGEGASACRLQCTGAADCPEGWGCSVAGLCREPSGKFASIGEGVSAGVETLVVGDFDGDRRKDVLGSGPQSPSGAARVRVHYFGDDAQLAQVNTLSASISSPTVKDFNKDGIDDFAFGLDIGALGVISGQPDRSLIPAVFPSFRNEDVDAKPVSIRTTTTRELPAGGSFDFLFAGTITLRPGEVLNALASTGDGYARPLPVDIQGIIGEPLWGKLLSDPSSTCGEIALAMKQGDNGIIHVYAPCRPKIGNDAASEWAPLRGPIVINPPGPLAGIQIVDEKTNDGHADVLMAVGKGEARRIYLARGNGLGFDAPIETPLFDLPIASGDLDFDGKADLVFPGGILLSGPPGGGAPIVDAGADAGSSPGETPFKFYTPRLSDRRVRWTSARIGDFNGDAFPDVVAASADQPDLDFFVAVSPGDFVQSSISTSGPVSHIAVGDFDGDQLIDIGFMQKPPGSGAAFDVSVAYARTNGPPEPARVIGRTEEASALLTFGDPGVPGLDSLALFFRKPASDGGLPDLAIAVILGNGDRQPIAPLLLDRSRETTPETDPDIEREWVPLEVHAGTPIDPNRVDLIALAVGYRVSRSRQALAPGPFPSAVWVAPGLGATSFDAPRQVQDLAGFSVPGSGTLVFEARTVLGDLDNPKDGKSDVIVLQRFPNEDSLGLSVVRPVSDQGGLNAPDPIELPGERIRRDAPFVVTDVDADGNLDAVVILGDAATAKVVIFYNDGSGGFVTPGATIPLPEGELAKGFAHLTTGGASIDGKRRATRELAIVTSKRLFIAAPDAGDRAKLVVRDVVTGGGAALVGGTAIASGDFDGDGVEDLAIADSGTLRILRQLPVRR